jgi:hypothetical protein
MKVSHLDQPLENYFMEKVMEHGEGKPVE